MENLPVPGPGAPDTGGGSDPDLLVRYREHLKTRGFRAAKLYAYAAEGLLRWMSARKLDISQVVPQILNDYLIQRRTSDQKPKTGMAAVSRLRKFFRFAVAEQLIAEDPTAHVSHLWLDVPGGLPACGKVLRRIFPSPYDALRFRCPLFAPHWERYLQQLSDQQYARHSLHHITSYNAAFHSYLEKNGARRFRDATMLRLEAFLVERQEEFRQRRGRPMADEYLIRVRECIEAFLTFGWQKERGGRCDTRRRISKTPISESMVDEYLTFSREHKGLSPASVRGYLRNLQLFRRFLGRKGLGELSKLEPKDIDEFMVEQSRHLSPRGLKTVATGLRSFLAFVHLVGYLDCDLAATVVSPCRFSMDLRPKYHPWHRVEEILAKIDRSTVLGKRDYALLCLLAFHGLRVREVRGLPVDDVDLEGGRLRLRHRKNGVLEDIPLTERAAQSLRDYLAVRRQTTYPDLFLTEHAPLRPLAGQGISSVAQRVQGFGRLGGGYVFRHSFAKALLDRGAKLHDVGAMLGHKSLRSTLIYTRISTEELREVADNYGAWL